MPQSGRQKQYAGNDCDCMWLITTQGFYSVVAHRDDPDLLLVRARKREDIEALSEQIPSLEPFWDRSADSPPSRWSRTSSGAMRSGSSPE